MTSEIEKVIPPPSDLRTLAKLAIWAVVVLVGAAVLGLAVRVFVAMSGFGG